MVSALRLVCPVLSLAIVAFGQAPRLFFTDLENGPNTGGENNNGAYVTVYGKGFGATRGSSTVTIGGGQASAYPVWTDTKLSFQLGPNARTGNIVVTTSAGTSNALPFTVRAGNIYFVSTTGNDSSSGSFSSPWRTLKQCKNTFAPGDICYGMNGINETSQDVFDSALDLVKAAGGQENSGTAGKPKAIVAYPGASVSIGSTSLGYGIRVPNVGFPANYWVLAGLRVVGRTAIEFTSGSSNIRVIGNDLSAPTGSGQAACFVASRTAYVKFLGNNVHGCGATNAGKQFHNVYFTTDASHAEVGWNQIHNSNGCRGVQFHSSPLDSNTGYNQYDLDVHDNVIHDIVCDAINFTTVDPSKGAVRAYNNVIYNAGTGPDPNGDASSYTCVFVPGWTNAGAEGSGVVEVFNNTLYNCGSRRDGSSGAIGRPSGNSALRVNLRNNIIYQLSGEAYLTPGTDQSLVTGSNNLWFGLGNGPSVTSANINADPKFASIAGVDFHLQSSSPAINAGVNTAILRDADGNPRPIGSAVDIGAYEFGTASGTAPSNPCDLTGDGSVGSADVDLAKQQALGTTGCANGDLDANGACNVVDVQRVINAAVGGNCRVGP